MKTICVYSGSNSGLHPEYQRNARLLGKILVENKIELIYGGSSSGLMGEISNEVLKNNGLNLLKLKICMKEKKLCMICPMDL